MGFFKDKMDGSESWGMGKTETYQKNLSPSEKKKN
jgi:hypothetical protein